MSGEATVRYGVRDGIAALGIANPPVNALSIGAGVVAGLRDAIEAALADPDVSGILIHGEGAMFCAGADITDFSGELAAIDTARTLSARIEQSIKPVVAAIHGMALGGGLELAMVCHHRIAATGTIFGLPEVTLGILPGNGGTQRLPRLVGVARALEMMLGGRPIDAPAALAAGLIDAIVDGDPVEAARVYLHEAGGPVRRTCDLPVAADPDAIAAARARLAAKPGLNEAPAAILACVEATLTQDLAGGLAAEQRLFEQLMASEPSLGLRHAFFGQRQVARIPGLPRDIAPAKIASTAVVGAGLMGTGIAIAILNAGLPMVLVEARADALDKAVARIGQTIRREVEKGRISAAEAEARVAQLTPATTLDAVAEADLVIEAVFEDMAVKQGLFRELDGIAKPGAILASNTSTLDVDAIAAVTARPGQVVGLHFFSPANIMRLLEIVRGARTEPGVLATTMAFARKIGKVGVVAGVCDGFIGNRIFEEYLRQAYLLLEQGALPAQVDRALEAWGMAMGPLKVMDLAGQDIGWSIRQRRAIEQPDRPYSRIPDLVCELGRFGQKTGAGFYLYPDGRTAEVDPEIDALIVRHSAEIGIVRRTIDDAEIVDRCVLAMVNEGARIVEEGIAYRPVDIDIVYLNGYGFPAERGGPMFHADRLGLHGVLERIRAFAAGPEGWAWRPAGLLIDLAARGADFGSLNR